MSNSIENFSADTIAAVERALPVGKFEPARVIHQRVDQNAPQTTRNVLNALVAAGRAASRKFPIPTGFERRFARPASEAGQ